ncbi:WD repeat-containing protein 47 [Trichonephila inaurata madagascariensis]|uniref:WD repeat-containing protein 47 n=1 Tax=Trichonephila inaurata madagascariensis TaxID=2747483 RepID=A0A8X6YU51_9ARAC|nr:WD repeat-containing protein 47 [Trichonephila inaurata madagascariensis]
MFAPCCGPPTSYYMWPHQQLPNLWTRPMPTVTSTLPAPTKPCPMHDLTPKKVHEKLQRACSAPKPLSGKKKGSKIFVHSIIIFYVIHIPDTRLSFFEISDYPFSLSLKLSPRNIPVILG